MIVARAVALLVRSLKAVIKWPPHDANNGKRRNPPEQHQPSGMPASMEKQSVREAKAFLDRPWLKLKTQDSLSPVLVFFLELS